MYDNGSKHRQMHGFFVSDVARVKLHDDGNIYLAFCYHILIDIHFYNLGPFNAKLQQKSSKLTRPQAFCQ